MSNVNNVFTDLFDILIPSNYDGIIIYPNKIPQFWKSKFKGQITGCDPMSLEEILSDLEALNISIYPDSFGSKETRFEYSSPDSSLVRLRIKFTRQETMERLVIYKP